MWVWWPPPAAPEDPPDVTAWQPEEIRADRSVDAVLLLIALVFAAGLIVGAVLW